MPPPAAPPSSPAVTGKGGHAAMPQTVVDPIVAAAGIVGAVQTIVSRETDPLGSSVISVTRIHAGEGQLMAQRGQWHGSASSCPSVTHGTTICRGCVQRHPGRGGVRWHAAGQGRGDHGAAAGALPGGGGAGGAGARVHGDGGLDGGRDAVLPTHGQRCAHGCPRAVGGAGGWPWCRASAGPATPSDTRLPSPPPQRMLGAGRVEDAAPSMAGEDFGFITRVLPAAYTFLGIRNEDLGSVWPLHSPRCVAEAARLAGLLWPLDAASHALLAGLSWPLDAASHALLF